MEEFFYVIKSKRVDGLIRDDEDLESAPIFNRQTVELIEKRRCLRESGCIVDKSGCTVLDMLGTHKESRRMSVKKTVAII